jgi:SAM-dependent methyltransferase
MSSERATETATAPAARRDAVCLYCGGTTFRPHFHGIKDRLRYVPGSWAFDRCQDCHSLLLAPFPETSAIPGFYPAVYSFSLDLDNQNAIRRWLGRLEYHLFYGPHYRAQVRQVLRGIGWRGERRLRLLDIGCGRGLRLTAFHRQGFEVQGLDLQPEVVDYVRSRLGLEANVGGADSLATEIAPESFDVVTAFYLLEHVPNVDEVLAGCLRVLRPGGWFVGVVPICDGLQAQIFGQRWLHVTEAPRHLSLPSRGGLLRAAERAGYELLRLRSDAVLNCAGIVAGSLLPGSDLTSAYGKRGWLGPMIRRMAGGACVAASIPFCLAENLSPRTSHAMLLARKPPRS